MERKGYLAAIEQAFAVHPVVAILGPRQCGKTTLARMYAEAKGDKAGIVTHLDLEDPTDQARLADPKLFLARLEGLVIIEEVQRAPALFEVLRVLVDRVDNRAQYLLLGSASRDLIKQGSESLAGRIEYLELSPFQLSEVEMGSLETLWLRGGFPRSFLARNAAESLQWRNAYIATFLERDIPNLGIQIPPSALRRFWMMLSHTHTQILNLSELGRSLSVADTTVRRYLDILTGTYMVRQLQPWFENISKRQVRSPKLYFRDAGILHAFLGTNSYEDLSTHPKLGASWEGFCVEEIIRFHHARDEDVFFWATHGTAELDLLVLHNGKKIGYEVKYTSRPRVTKSMRIACTDIGLDQLTVIYPGTDRFPLAEKIEAVGLAAFFAA